MYGCRRRLCTRVCSWEHFLCRKKTAAVWKKNREKKRARFFYSRECTFFLLPDIPFDEFEKKQWAHADATRGTWYHLQKVLCHRERTRVQSPSLRPRRSGRRRRHGSICSAGGPAHDGPLSPSWPSTSRKGRKVLLARPP